VSEPELSPKVPVALGAGKGDGAAREANANGGVPCGPPPFTRPREQGAASRRPITTINP
jgi:hypothetical protein